MIAITKTSLISVISLSMMLSACGDSSSGEGSLNLNITDAPVDNADKVVVSFSGVSLKPESGSAYDIDFVDANGDPLIKSIDLLTLQGTSSESLLEGQTLDAGRYNWMRLKVISSKTETDSYIEVDGLMYPLYVPSGNETGLKLNQGFDIADGGTASFTIDFDLRKSIVSPGNNPTAYKLKPTLRMVENNNSGHISGTVGSVALGDTSCTTGNAVYVYTGDAVTPDDVGGANANPVTTALVSDTDNSYTAGFLDAGTYMVAFTCMSNDDLAETDDAITFIGAQSVTVTAGTTTTHNFN